MNNKHPATEHLAKKLKDQKQQKYSHPPHAPQNELSQKSISELFPASKHRLQTHESQDPDSPSPAKRLKRGPPPAEAEQNHIPSKSIQLADMYKLPSTKFMGGFNSGSPSKSPEVVDLTISPPGSPLNSSRILSKPSGVLKPLASGSHVATKKLVVKNLRNTPRADPNQYFDQIWSRLNIALSAIFRAEKIPYSMEELYRGVEMLCRQDRASVLFKRLREKCRDEASTRLKEPLTTAANTAGDADLLNAVVRSWTSWTAHIVSPLQHRMAPAKLF